MHETTREMCETSKARVTFGALIDRSTVLINSETLYTWCTSSNADTGDGAGPRRVLQYRNQMETMEYFLTQNSIFFL